MAKLSSIHYIIIFIAVFILGFFSFNAYIYNQKQGTGSTTAPYQGTLTGEYVCLPHANQEGPQTLECAFGMKTEAGEYYALDFNNAPQAVQDIAVGDKFSASGTITPIENISSDIWQKYTIEGIFSINNTIEKL